MLGFVAYYVVEGEAFSFAALEDARAAAARGLPEGDPGAGTDMQTAPHPYWGFSPLPEGRTPKPGVDLLTNIGPDVPARAAGEIHVAVFGGSMAVWTSSHLRERLMAALQERGLLRDRQVVVYVAAQGKLKQPQQLTKLAYVLARGAEFDIVVNLDGFNELYISDRNLTKGTFPFYPGFWADLTGGWQEPALLLRLGAIALKQHRRARVAEVAGHPLLRCSVLASTTWLFVDRIQAVQIAHARIELDEARRARPRSYVSQGPEYPSVGLDELFRDLASVWMRSSLAMRALSEESGARYFHFLQPNQYLPDSKPMGVGERRRALDAFSLQRRSVRSGYPLLIERGRELRAQGVNYYDLTMLFAQEPAPLYIDTCCHLSPEGNRRVAAAISRAIADDLASLESENAGARSALQP
jgi:hypothetical protein